MQFNTIFASVMAFAGMVAAQTPGKAIVNVESSHGGAGSGLVNKTIEFPFNTPHTDPATLNEVSTLYLIGASANVPLESVTCTPYKSTDGQGEHALPFNSKTPSRLSTNTVQVGSIVCESSA